MYRIITENKRFDIAFDASDGSKGKINGEDFSMGIEDLGKGAFHLIRNDKSFRAEVIRYDHVSRTVEVEVEGDRYAFRVRDRYDQLLEQLGLDQLTESKARDLPAPMPGLVLEVKVKQGDRVKKGDALVILEAMKMENVLKAACDAVVERCLVKKGDSAEKNEILISFK